MGLGTTIAIDGPGAAGKTVVGRLVAQRLGYRFLDTGLMYRAVAWGALRQQVSLDDAVALTRLTRGMSIEVVASAKGERVLLDGEDVTKMLHTSAVDEASSQVAGVSGIREALVVRQRAMADEGKMVMVGRDIGTVVLPQAGVKVFLQASVAERARRRHREFLEAGQYVDYATVERELAQRDRRDTQRAHSPLRPAPGAHMVETDGATVQEVLGRIMALVRGAQA